MNWPTKTLEEAVIGAQVAHDGHPVLRWMARKYLDRIRDEA